MWRMMCVLMAGLLFAPVDFAQIPRRLAGEESQFIFFEAVSLFTPDSTLSRVDVHYRIDENFFIALRNTDPSFPWPFKRKGEILIELLDANSSSAARSIKRIELGANTGERTDSATTWYQKIVSFEILPGAYTLAIEVSDLESERRFIDRSRTVDVTRRANTRLAASTPILLFPLTDSTPEDPSYFLPQNYGGNVLFGSGGAFLLQVHSESQKREDVTVRYYIKEQSPPDEEPVNGDLEESPLVSQVSVFQAGLKVDSLHSRYTLVPGAGPEGTYTVVAALPLEQLLLRRFELTASVHIGNDSVNITKAFRTVWPDMPRSLRNIDMALDALKFITRKSQLDSLKDGPFELRRHNLERFWQEKGQTPGTSYNEIMAEYYRRVDYAMQNFGTLKEPDGSKNDRGRIYILHGLPTKTERNLSASAGYQEVWTYEKLKKRFIFADESKSGLYVLISTQHL